jgi:hypothetical protein
MYFKDISAPTASRDLKVAVDKKKLSEWGISGLQYTISHQNKLPKTCLRHASLSGSQTKKPSQF